MMYSKGFLIKVDNSFFFNYFVNVGLVDLQNGSSCGLFRRIVGAPRGVIAATWLWAMKRAS